MTRRAVRQGRRPTRDDVARLANLSGATVSRVMSGRTDIPITAETRARILDAARELGYRPHSGTATETGPTGLVAVWTSLCFSPRRARALDAIRTALREADLALAVADFDGEAPWAADRALRLPVDGIVALDLPFGNEAFAMTRARLAPLTPCVLFGGEAEGVSSVDLDLRRGAALAARHLRETGRSRVAFLLADDRPQEAGPWLAACREAFDGVLVPVTPAELAAARADIVLCADEETADATGSLSVPLAVLAAPLQEMAAVALELLHAQMADPSLCPSAAFSRPGSSSARPTTSPKLS